ncbi:beta family protein [Oceanicaulis sp.]|uniref:beta family protein n=1 Tax=Oceanicaulis sp. TaxID=1924941 RepID=UPI003F70CCBF
MFENISPYIPTLSVKPAEMAGLKNLPGPTKFLLSPHILLRPWVGSEYLESSIKVILEAYDSPCIIELDPSLDLTEEEGERSVFAELRALTSPDDGHRNWVNFINKHEPFTPTLIQTGTVEQIKQQASAFSELGRGIVMRIRLHSNIEATNNVTQSLDILDILNGVVKPEKFLLIADFGQRAQGWEYQAAIAHKLLSAAKDKFPISNAVVSSTTFPLEFDDNIPAQSVYERGMFQQLQQLHPELRLVYGDRGSARAESLDIPLGAPLPRIDLALEHHWYFFRERPDYPKDRRGLPVVLSPEERKRHKKEAYIRAARRAIDSEHWLNVPNVWGRQLILDTFNEAETGIYSPARATAARINIHLFQQANYGSKLLPDPEEDWEEF